MAAANQKPLRLVDPKTETYFYLTITPEDRYNLRLDGKRDRALFRMFREKLQESYSEMGKSLLVPQGQSTEAQLLFSQGAAAMQRALIELMGKLENG